MRLPARPPALVPSASTSNSSSSSNLANLPIPLARQPPALHQSSRSSNAESQQSARQQPRGLSPFPRQVSLGQASTSATAGGPAGTGMSAAFRPPPARQGQPASQRNFGESSAGGASSHLGMALADERSGKAVDGGSGTKKQLSEVQRRKRERWGPAYVRCNSPSRLPLQADLSSRLRRSRRKRQSATTTLGSMYRQAGDRRTTCETRLSRRDLPSEFCFFSTSTCPY